MLKPGALLVGRYSIARLVRNSGTGSVYQALDTQSADNLCTVNEFIRFIDNPLHRDKALYAFKAEADIAAKLRHPSLLVLKDYFINEDKFYQVTPWIDGGDLDEEMRARGGTVDEATVTKWAVQICDVLHYLHSQQPPIIYRDLKPANLVLDEMTGRIMLVAFGNTMIVRPTDKGVTIIGSMGYAPPELFAGKAETRSNLYSLGAIMFQMLTGSDPQDNPLLIFDFSKFPRPRQINPKISEGMEKILMRTVAHEVTDRPESALQLMRELQEHLDLLA